jgi:hypothetical protein
VPGQYRHAFFADSDDPLLQTVCRLVTASAGMKLDRDGIKN